VTERSDTLDSALNTPPDLPTPQPPLEPATCEPQQAELAPAWATKLQADITTLQEQVAQCQARKLSNTQPRAVATSITRAVAASNKELSAKIGAEFKDLGRRLKEAEKALRKIQRKLKKK
jgi:hypothetical protein